MIADLRLQISDLEPGISNFGFGISDLELRIWNLCFPYLTASRRQGIWNLELRTWDLELVIWDLELGIWNL